MLQYYKFAAEVAAPSPAREVYRKRGKGQGWPEQCPSVRQASAFGWDVLAHFDLTFLRKDDGTWRLENECALLADWDPGLDEGEDDAGDDFHEPEDRAPAMVQHAAWFWDPKQTLPHPISAHVYEQIKNQVKVSSFLYLKTDPGEVLMVTDIPNRDDPGYRAVPAIIETDWYAASYPWHGVLELDATRERVTIAKGDPMFRVMLLQRGIYQAQAMSSVDFTAFFERSQTWLQAHGHGVGEDGMVDIRRSYGKKQLPSTFWTDD